jgi:hypothetical protein
MNDKLKTIAEYDGWVIKGEPDFTAPYKIFVKELPDCNKMIPYISSTGKEYDGWEKELKYLTSLDWLHPVAMKVLGELRKIEAETAREYESQPLFVNGVINEAKIRARKIDMAYACINSILVYCQIPARKNGEYTDLFNATVEGIIYLQNHSK